MLCFPLFIGNSMLVFVGNSWGSVRMAWQGWTAAVGWSSVANDRGRGPGSAASSAR